VERGNGRDSEERGKKGEVLPSANGLMREGLDSEKRGVRVREAGERRFAFLGVIPDKRRGILALF